MYILKDNSNFISEWGFSRYSRCQATVHFTVDLPMMMDLETVVLSKAFLPVATWSFQLTPCVAPDMIGSLFDLL